MTAAALVAAARAAGLTIATAESCTGGMLAAAITAIPGASAVFGAGYVTYSNAAKTALLGVPAALIETQGAVSEATAAAMATGARHQADLAIAITGIAGPGGGTTAKPVGTVCFGLAAATTRSYTRHFPGDRDAIRAASTDYALMLLLEEVSKK